MRRINIYWTRGDVTVKRIYQQRALEIYDRCIKTGTHNDDDDDEDVNNSKGTHKLELILKQRITLTSDESETLATDIKIRTDIPKQANKDW